MNMKLLISDEHRIKTLTVPKWDIDKFELLEKFASTDDTRKFLCVIYWDSTAKCLVSTDGYRLVKVDGTKLQLIDQFPVDHNAYLEYNKGILYMYAENTFGAGGFPNWSRVMPEEEQLMTNGVKYPLYKQDKKHKSSASSNMGIALILVDTGIALNIQFLTDLMGWEWEVWVAKEDSTRKTVVFTNDFATAIIQPFAHDQNKPVANEPAKEETAE